jgi:dTDP-4-amino-4,6-dideoxygalactose transaminase
MYKKINNLIKQYSNKQYSFITGNGTSAIYLTLKVLDLPKGSKIAVPNISCPDPVYALIWAGYKPIFIDINLDDYNIDIEKLEYELKSNDIKVIIAIHLFGNSCDIVSIKNLAKKYNCFLIEDCAQAFGNEVKEGKLGSFGDVSIFSFGNGKIIEVGHGGSVQTNNKELMTEIQKEYKKLPKYDKNKIDKLSKYHRRIYYKLYYLGIKYPKLNVLNLVYVYFFKNYYLYQIDKKYLETIYKKLSNSEQDKINRIKTANSYIQELESLDFITLPKLNNVKNILSRYTVIIDNSEKISKQIREYNMPSNTMYPMLINRFKIFFDKNNFQNSYKLKGKLLNLWTNDISSEKIKKQLDIIKKGIAK